MHAQWDWSFPQVRRACAEAAAGTGFQYARPARPPLSMPDRDVLPLVPGIAAGMSPDVRDEHVAPLLLALLAARHRLTQAPPATCLPAPSVSTVSKSSVKGNVNAASFKLFASNSSRTPADGDMMRGATIAAV
eukprot:gene8381-biopygen3931